MPYVIVGLGNPTEEYERTRHNVGRMAVAHVAEALGLSVWEHDAKANAQVSVGKVAKNKVILLLPDTYMNRSGSAVKKFVTSKKAAERLVVVYDDIDLPLGKIKISFGRSSGGHRGIDSIIRAVGTKDFIRVRIGVSPISAKGVARKPKGEEKVLNFLLGNFTKREEPELKSVLHRTSEAIEAVVGIGYERAMNTFN